MGDNKLNETALKKAMALCAARENCTKDIRSKLSKWGVDDTGTERIIEMLIHDNFLSDNRYAKAFTRDRFKCNKWGKIKIASQLRIKGIPENIILSALEEINDKEYMDMIRETITTHSRFIKAKSKFDLKGKLLRFGLSKGFESHLLYDLLNDWE